MKDQYGNPVPADLTILPNEILKQASEEEIKQIDQLDWYEAGFETGPSNLIFVSAAKLEEIDGIQDIYPPEEFGINPKILYIDSCLHRFNEVDGFYHA